jgi:Glyoxalase-like domain
LIKVDHVALAVRNLYEGFMDFRRETGLEVIEGGYFPAFGIANKLIPLGRSTFIEIEATIDYRAGMKSLMGKWFYDVAENGAKWVGLCLRVGDLAELEEVGARLGTAVYVDAANVVDGVAYESSYFMANGEKHPPQPRTPDASVWKQGLPTFFVMDMTNHVGNVEMPHKHKTDGFAWLEIGGTEKQAQDWIGVHPDELHIRCNGKSRLGLYAVAIKTEGDDIVVRYDWE